MTTPLDIELPRARPARPATVEVGGAELLELLPAMRRNGWDASVLETVGLSRWRIEWGRRICTEERDGATDGPTN